MCAKRFAGEGAAQLYASAAPQSFSDPRVVGRVDDDEHVRVVLRRRPNQARPADVDVFQHLGHAHARLGGGLAERVEVADDDVDKVDVVFGQGLQVFFAAVGEDAAVNPGVQGFDTPVQNLGKVRHLCDRRDVQTCVF